MHKLCSQLRASFLIWFHFRSSYMIYFIYICHIHLLHGNVWTHNWPVPNISDFTAQLVGASPGYREVEGSNSIDVLNFFQVSSYTQLHKLPSQLRGSFCIWSFLNEMANHFIRPGFPVFPNIKLVPGAFLLRKYGGGPWNEIELKWTSTIFCYW